MHLALTLDIDGSAPFKHERCAQLPPGSVGHLDSPGHAVGFHPAGNWLFGTAPIGPDVWLLAGLFAALMWALEEVRKACLRRTVV